MTYPVKTVIPGFIASSVQAATFLPVCNRTHFNGNGASASTALIQQRSHSSRVLLKVIAAAANIQVEWANIWTSTLSGQSEMNGPNSVTARFAVEYPAGNPRQVSGSTAWSSITAYALLDQVTVSGTHYVCIQANTNNSPAISPTFWTPVVRYIVRWTGDTDGNGTIVFAPGSYLQSVPIVLTNGPLQPGLCLAICSVFDTGATTNYLPFGAFEGGQNKAPYVDWIINSASAPVAGSDLAATGVTTQTNGTASTANWTNPAATGQTITPAAFPTAITGDTPVKRCTALFGDSIMAGDGGDWRDGSPVGPGVRLVDGTSWWRIAQGGNRAVCYAPSIANPWQMSVLRRCHSIVTNFGINDINVGSTVAQVKAALTACWQWLAMTGLPVYQTMLTPIASSTDSWVTLVNQGQYTAGGTIATTQYPGGAETYAASVYGQVQMWMSQQGAPITLNDGTSVAAGQAYHPLKSVIDWSGAMRDQVTGWKWAAGGTSVSADGAHPNPYIMGLEMIELGDVAEAIILGRQRPASRLWTPSNANQGCIAPFDRSMVTSTATTDTNTFLFTLVGQSPGKYISFLTWFLSSAPTTTAGFWSLLCGLDGTYLRCVASGPVTYTANVNSVAIGTVGSPMWIPPGQLMYAVFTKTASQATLFGSQKAAGINVNVATTSHLLAGGTTGTAAALTVGNTFSVMNATSWTAALAPVVDRLWAEVV